ncbi:TonB-dependent siderophore receptor [Frateuria aurantia]
MTSILHCRHHLLAISLTLATGLGTTAGAAMALPAADPAAVQLYHLPSAPLGSTLLRIARDSGHVLSIDPRQLASLQAPAIQGRYTPEQAARAALSGSHLQLVIAADGSWTAAAAPEDGSTQSNAVRHLSSRPQRHVKSLQSQYVYGRVNNGYAATTSEAATKTAASLLETPAAISVVTRQQMDAQAIQNVPQALRYTSGILTAQRGFSEDGGGLEEMYVRGFVVDQYLDGLRLPSPSVASYGASAIDPYSLDAIELVHGPASVLYGQSSPGGLINLVSKTPTDTPLHEIGLQTGSYARRQLQFDFSDHLSDNLSYRVEGLARAADTQVDHVHDKRVMVAPSLKWTPTSGTTLIVQGGYQNDPDAGYYNTLPRVGTEERASFGYISPHLDPGDPDYDSHRRKQYWFGYQLNQQLSSHWSFTQKLRYMENRDDLRGIFTNGWSWNDGNEAQGVLGRYALGMHEVSRSLAVDNQFHATFDQGAIHQDVLFGIDFQRLLYHERYGYNWFGVPGLNVTDPVYGESIAAPTISGDAHTRLNQTGLYGQDMISWGHWRLLLAGREDWARSDTLDGLDNVMTTQSKHKFTTHLGLTYVSDIGLAPYASYATSFQPQTTASLEDGSTPRPTTGKQYELGLKYQPPGKQSFVSLAGYHLMQQNVLTTDPVTMLQYLTGAVRSRGIELEAHAQLTQDLVLVGSYSYLDQVTTSTRESDELGKRLVGIPRNTTALWLDYSFHDTALDGLGVNVGVRYIGSSYGDSDNTFKVPGYAVLDAGLHYERQNWSYYLNISNLANRLYLASCMYSANACNYGALRSVMEGVTYRW